jgi:TonB family protein
MKLPVTFSYLYACALLSFLSVAPAFAEPLSLMPSSSWNIDYGRERCSLIRSFGSGDDQVDLTMARYGPSFGTSDFFIMTVSGKKLQFVKMADDAQIRFGPDEAQQTIGYFSGITNGGDLALIYFRLRIAALSKGESGWRQDIPKPGHVFAPLGSKREGQVRYLEIKRPLRQHLILQTGAMAKPLAALTKCSDGLLENWGFDVQTHRTLKRGVTPVGSPGEWVTQQDYPLKMARDGRRAIVYFRLDVDPNGTPTKCHVQHSVGPEEFDIAVCDALMRNAKFQPALNGDGNAVSSYWQTSVIFDLP